MEELQAPLLSSTERDDGSRTAEPQVVVEDGEDLLLQQHPSERSDNDDGSSSSSSSSAYQPALIYWSNVTFLIGSCLYFALSLIDWRNSWKLSEAASDADDTANSASSDDYGSNRWDAYTLFTLLAPLSYLVNAMQDTYQNLKGGSSSSSANGYCQVCTKQLGIDLLFGVAAFLDAAGTMVESLGFGHDIVSEKFVDDMILSTSAVHVYLFQAILVCWMRVDDYGNIVSNYLQWGGDGLFLIGSLIDVIISYMVLDDMEESHVHWVLAASLLSATLWLVDAIFYISADCVEYRHYQQQDHTHHSELGDVEDNDLLLEEATVEDADIRPKAA